jgi:hypothetical protein
MALFAGCVHFKGKIATAGCNRGMWKSEMFVWGDHLICSVPWTESGMQPIDHRAAVVQRSSWIRLFANDKQASLVRRPVKKPVVEYLVKS